jgi:hypothetical protein
MCRIISFSNVSKVANLELLANTCRVALSDQSHGFGFVFLKEDNSQWGERTNNTKEYEVNFSKPLLNADWLGEAEQNRFGTPSKTARAAIFHGRISTNNKALVNVHPIVKHGWSLVHNGVVTDSGAKYEMITNNDSEHVLERLATGGIDSVASSLKGYYAFTAFDDKGQMHVGRDQIAPLFCAWITSIESYIYATSKDDIIEVVEALQFTGLSDLRALLPDVYLVHTLASGAIEWRRFVSLGRDSYSTSKAKLSLGKSFSEFADKEQAKEPKQVKSLSAADAKEQFASVKKLNDLIELESGGDAYTKAALHKFFNFIKTDKDYFVLKPNGLMCPKPDYLKMSPEKQLDMTVVQYGETGEELELCPYNFAWTPSENFYAGMTGGGAW